MSEVGFRLSVYHTRTKCGSDGKVVVARFILYEKTKYYIFQRPCVCPLKEILNHLRNFHGTWYEYHATRGYLTIELHNLIKSVILIEWSCDLLKLDR
jgi:hypothetical protein